MALGKASHRALSFSTTMPIDQQILSDVLEQDAFVREQDVEVRLEFFDAPTPTVMGHNTQQVGVPLHGALAEPGISNLFPQRAGNRAP